MSVRLSSSVVNCSGCVGVQLLSSVKWMASEVQPENFSDVENRPPIGKGRKGS